MPNKLAIDDVEVAAAHILVLSGKVYCLGCSTKKRQRKGEKLRSPWAMAYDPSLDVWESLPNPPPHPEGGRVNGIFSAGFPTPSSPCIVVGLPVVGVIQFYDVDTKIWQQEEFICDIFYPKDLRGKEVAVGVNLLCGG
ncbi:hypothetical protein RHMOL_Rhmol07G0222300 [Rhododendron molle]|uniref:Uncharacterized protein n=1 Tax=Rhododendron molle TaxID=49168 RepID=A0ACC0N4N3_RHOML|nr:hypothetical protein RHMOL_Rhmol07G0222300 [Rhododendron molle]